jgi:hypothetical protein
MSAPTTPRAGTFRRLASTSPFTARMSNSCAAWPGSKPFRPHNRTYDGHLTEQDGAVPLFWAAAPELR